MSAVRKSLARGVVVMQTYNPIVRTFGQVRAALLSSCDVARRDIRPDTPLVYLLPEAERRAG